MSSQKISAKPRSIIEHLVLDSISIVITCENVHQEELDHSARIEYNI